MIRIDDIVQIPAALVPETDLEGFPSTDEKVLPVCRERAGDVQSIEPQGLDFHWFADARGDDPVADLGIHPSELGAGLTGSE